MDDNYEGTFPTSLRFNCLTGALAYSDFDPAAGGFVLQEIELGTEMARFAMDLLTRQHGWAHIADGIFDVITVPVSSPLPPRPSPNHKPARAVAMWNPMIEDALWTMGAFNLVKTIDHFWLKLRPAEQAARGLIPIVSIVGLHTVRNQRANSDIYVPDVRLDGWEERAAIPGWGERPITVPPPVILSTLPRPVNGLISGPMAAKPVTTPGRSPNKSRPAAVKATPPPRDDLGELLDDEIPDFSGED